MSISPLFFDRPGAKKKKRCKHGPGSPAWPIFIRHARKGLDMRGKDGRQKNEENSRENKKGSHVLARCQLRRPMYFNHDGGCYTATVIRIYLYGITVKLYTLVIYPGCTVGEYMCSWIIRYCRWPKEKKHETNTSKQSTTRHLGSRRYLQLHLEMASLATKQRAQVVFRASIRWAKRT